MFVSDKCSLAGFKEVIPTRLLVECEIDEKDLGMLVSGVAEVDVTDWRANTTQPIGNPTVDWFWEVLDEFGTEQRARTLQFATGLSRLPPEGFRGLSPRFEVMVDASASKQRLPTAHTCFNRLDLPPYESHETVAEKLTLATQEGCGNFAFR